MIDLLEGASLHDLAELCNASIPEFQRPMKGCPRCGNDLQPSTDCEPCEGTGEVADDSPEALIAAVLLYGAMKGESRIHLFWPSDGSRPRICVASIDSGNAPIETTDLPGIARAALIALCRANEVGI